MSNLEEIEIIIDAKGKTQIRVSGVPGAGCVDTTAALEARLGKLVGEREKTAEYYQPDAPDTTVHLHERRG